MMTTSPVSRLRRSDLGRLETLLDASNLPNDDCADQADHFYAIFEDGRVIAAGGLQPAGEYFLLRSLVVDVDCRGRGLGRRLTDFLLRLAEQAHSPAVYLLTETAEDYFAGFGFARIDRERVPEAIAGTRQFAALCPASASCLVLTLPRA